MQLHEKRKCKCVEHRGDEAWHGERTGGTWHRCACEPCRTAAAAYMRSYRKEKGEALRLRERAAGRAYNSAHARERRAQSRAYREANRDAIMRREAEYRKANRELLRERKRAAVAASPMAAKLRNGVVRRRYNEATKAIASRDGLRWTSADDATVMRQDLSLVEIACTLGRTYDAVVLRRFNIRRGNV